MKRNLATGLMIFFGTTFGFCQTLKMAYDADPVSLDPHEQLSGGTLQMSHLLFDPLLRWTPDFQLQGRLAESWEQTDPTHWKVRLRPEVPFHSGRILYPEDVIWTFQRLKESPDFKALFAPFTACRAVDEHTVEFETGAPYPLAPAMLTYLFPMDREFYTGTDDAGRDKSVIAKHGDSFASHHVGGTGPFTVQERIPGQRTRYVRNPAYWDRSSPGNVKEVILTPIREDATRVAALLAGDVDFIAPVPPQDLDRLSRSPETQVVTLPGTRIIMLQMNAERCEPLRDRRVREAFNLAVNNEGIAQKIMRGQAKAAGQLSPEGYAGHDPALQPRYDLKKAQQLMKDAGFEKGFAVTMISPNNRYINDARIAEAVANMLGKINIRVDLQTMPKAQYWPRFDARDADLLLIGWHSDTEDSANFFEFLTMSPDPDSGFGQYNAGGYRNPELDKLILACAHELDPAKRQAMLRQAENMVSRDAVLIPLHWQNLSYAARKDIQIRPVLNALDIPYLGDLKMER